MLKMKEGKYEHPLLPDGFVVKEHRVEIGDIHLYFDKEGNFEGTGAKIPDDEGFEQTKIIDGIEYELVEASRNITHLEKMIVYDEIENHKILQDEKTKEFGLYRQS